MTPEERAALEAEQTDLSRKVRKREDRPGFAANVEEIKARIAEIDALLAAES